jgi:hypothetical protein
MEYIPTAIKLIELVNVTFNFLVCSKTTLIQLQKGRKYTLLLAPSVLVHPEQEKDGWALVAGAVIIIINQSDIA